jgi:hypothetical protein
VSILSSVFLPLSDLHQGDPPQCLRIALRTYRCICTLNPLFMLLFSHMLRTSWITSSFVTLLEFAHAHEKTGHFLSQFGPSTQNHHTTTRSLFALFHYEVTQKQSFLWLLDSIAHLIIQLANLPQELHVWTIFSSLLCHSSMLLHMHFYSLEWLGFTLNHTIQRNRNNHAQVISSCCNMLVYKTL